MLKCDLIIQKQWDNLIIYSNFRKEPLEITPLGLCFAGRIFIICYLDLQNDKKVNYLDEWSSKKKSQHKYQKNKL